MVQNKYRHLIGSVLFAAFLIPSHLLAQVFQNTATFPNARYAHASEKSLNENVLIFGGVIASGANINSVYEYDPFLNSWTPKASIPNAAGLSKSASVRLNNGNVILFGGSQNGSVPQSNKTFQYNINSDSWSLLANLPNSQGREQMRATLLNDTLVLLTGGLSSIASALNYLSGCYLYNTNDNTFTQVGNLPAGVINHTSTLLPNGEVLVTGGFDGNAARNEAFVFNLQNGWRTLPSTLSLAVSSHRAQLLSGKVYIYGGFNIPLFQFSNLMHVYNPLLDTIINTNSGPIACSQFAMAPYNSSILIAGGNREFPNGNFGVTDEAYLYDINTNSFSTITNLPDARSEMEVTELGNSGKFIFSGGHITLAQPFNDAIIYDANLTSGINENNPLNAVCIYPNPCNDILKLKFSGIDNPIRFEIYCALGQRIKLGEISSTFASISIQDLPQGSYVISFNSQSYQRFQIVR